MLKEFNFEAYTVHPETGEKGWDIKFISVIASDYKKAKEILKNWPLFDCIILHNYEVTATRGKEGEIYDTGGNEGYTGRNFDLIFKKQLH